MGRICFELILLAILAAVFFRGSRAGSQQTGFMSFEYTTVLRGIAILMVYLQHTMGALGTRVFTPLGGGGVAIFLILSGYGLTESFKKKGTKGFWKKKIVHVMLPWWIIYLLFLQDWGNVTGWDLVGYLSLTHIVHAWYLQYLFLWYVVFWLTHQFGALYRWRYAVMGAVAWVIFLWWGNIQAEQAATFVLGVWISDNKVRIAECGAAKKRRWLFGFCVVAVVSLGIKQMSSIREVLDSYVLLFHAEQLLLKTSIALTVICGLEYCKALQSNRFLKFTGVISYEMYLVHLFVVPPAMRCLGIGQGYAYVALFLALSYLVSYAFYLLNSKVLARI